ncbi:isochorismatase family cysteine hydrolase [Leadbettera azotonutricia]|uniref:Isochorismatase hydrolase n=1 Tax=Leadbettera azotonutricia (strain ATCC BAA-888 / DSM 13862 / ZAS-9) TaxID=545695 RepID=F5YBZ4_LEAAZ|nr:isochorismatase family cysteine hydrolase [Leadbettera azotonutricia]AEF82647.1 isochorismatase hydrolase [Leadbettera azotonutricia ZAS-9]
MKLALLIIDMQKAYYTGYAKESMDQASEYINYAVELFRGKNYPIIWVQDEDKKGNVIQGTIGFDLIDALKPKPDEKRIIKNYNNSFNKTGLLEYIIKEGVDTLIITGYNAVYCVLSTYRGALDHDLMPILLKNSLASNTKENSKFVEDISEIISINALEKFISGANE